MAMQGYTRGDWDWVVDGRGVYLGTPHSGQLLVMDFVRKGMNGAQPRFATWDGERGRIGGLMFPADKLNLADHPDAKIIKASPNLMVACERALAFIDPLPLDGVHSLERDNVRQTLRAAITRALS